MTMQNGVFVPDTTEDILEALMASARTQFGNDLNDDEEAVIRTFYRPIAVLLAEAQVDVATVLSQAQLEHAEGTALDKLTELIGVFRKEAQPATGTATFSRASAAGTDYTIPKGTVVQTSGVDPVKFKTAEVKTLASGTTSVDAPIEAVEPGVRGNVGANTVTVMASPPTGVESVTNATETDGGENEEADDDLRARAEDELSNGMLGTAPGVINALKKTTGVKSVSLFINDGSSTDTDGLESHHFEAVVEGGTDGDVGQALWESKAAADGSQGGVHGSAVTYQADLGNGNTHPVNFSRPTVVPIYVDIDLSTTDEYDGDSKVRDAIVQYLGGTLTSGGEEDGELRVSDDVVYTKILSAIMSVDGIADVPSLTIGKTASPTGSSNISIAASEIATGDATDGSITISEV